MTVQRDVAMFDALDRDKDGIIAWYCARMYHMGTSGRLTIEEVHGNIDLEARFNDIDINRDGVITREELARYIALRYGVASARSSCA